MKKIIIIILSSIAIIFLLLVAFYYIVTYKVYEIDKDYIEEKVPGSEVLYFNSPYYAKNWFDITLPEDKSFQDQIQTDLCSYYFAVDESTKEEYVKELFNLINEERVNRGLEKLVWVNDFAKVANSRAEDDSYFNQHYMHFTPVWGFANYHAFITNLYPSAEYTPLYPLQGNNVELSVVGSVTPQEAFDSLINSPYHEVWLMDANMKYIGVAFADKNWPFYAYDEKNGECFAEPSIAQRLGYYGSGKNLYYPGGEQFYYSANAFYVIFIGDNYYDSYHDNTYIEVIPPYPEVK